MNNMERNFISLLVFVFLLTGCEINQKDIKPEDGFLKIYNHPDELLSFYPEGLMQLADGDYLYIAAVKDESSDIEYPSTYLVRTGGDGVVKWTRTYDWLAPAPRLFSTGSQVGFVAMNQQFAAFAILVNPATGEIEGQNDLEMTMPLASYMDQSGNLVVLGFDNVSRSSWISRYNSSFTLQRSNKLGINDDLEYLIQRHLNRSGEEFPFFIGEYSTDQGTGYFVSCFYNYTLRTVFLDISSLNATGDIYSFRTDEAVSAMIHRSGSMFGFTGYYEGNNYVVAESELNVTTSQSVKDIPRDALYELTHKAKVVSGTLENEQGEFALFASQTNTSSIVVYQYDMGSDSLINTYYQGFDERVEVADLISTDDGGIAILAGVFILGKYQRPVLVKMPADQFLPEEE